MRSVCSIGVAGFVCLYSVLASAQAQARFPDDEQTKPPGTAEASPATPATVAAVPAAPTPGAAPTPATTPATAGSATAPDAIEHRHYADIPVPDQPEHERTRRPDIREADANVDRVVFLPTAETQPKGRLYFSAHELIFWQLGYAFTDHVQATVTTWPVIVEKQPFFIDGAVKVNLFRTDALRLAAIGGITYVTDTVSDAKDTASVARLAFSAQICITKGCWTSVVGSLSGWVPLNEDAEGTLYLGGVGLTSKLGKHVGLLLEVNSAGFYHNDFEFADGALVNYGLRFSGSNIGVDLTMLRPTDNTQMVMGIPWLSFTYRTDPLTH